MLGNKTFGFTVLEASQKLCSRSWFLGALLLGSVIFPTTSPAQLNPPTNGIVGWWRGEGDANDTANGHTGTLTSGVAFEPGLVGQAFSFQGNPNRVVIPSNDLILTNSLSLAAWIYPRQNSWHVVERASDYAGSVTYSFGLLDDGRFAFVVKDFSNPAEVLFAPGALNQWIHLCATLDGSTGDMRLYVNGQLASQVTTAIRPGGAFPPGHPSGIAIGNTPYYGDGPFPFVGLVDEVLIYNRALTPAEVAGLATPPDAPPKITVQPKSQVGYIGSDITFSVTAAGGGLQYRWSKDGFPLSTATNSTLTLPNVQLTDAGSYQVVVTNTAGQVTSSNAVLIVNPVGVSLGLYPGLAIEGAIGRTYGIQYTTNLEQNITWTSLGTLTLTQQVQIWFDGDANITSPSRSQRFYRAVMLP